MDRDGRREGREECGVVGRGGALDMGSVPLETSSGSAPDVKVTSQILLIYLLHQKVTPKSFWYFFKNFGEQWLRIR